MVAGEAGGYVGEGLADRGAVIECLDEEGIVLDHGGDVVGAVVVAHVLVVHGGGPAAGSILLGGVHALVRFGWLAVEVLVGSWHVAPPGGISYVADSLVVASWYIPFGIYFLRFRAPGTRRSVEA